MSKFKRVVAIVLLISIVLTSKGAFTFANQMGEVMFDGESDSKKNYFFDEQLVDENELTYSDTEGIEEETVDISSIESYPTEDVEPTVEIIVEESDIASESEAEAEIETEDIDGASIDVASSSEPDYEIY